MSDFFNRWLEYARQPFFLALSFLTRLPAPSLGVVKDENQGRSVLFYPLIGLIIGIIGVLPLMLVDHSNPVLPAVIVIIWILLSGGLHLDGLADSADAWLGGFSKGEPDREKTLAIMKDSSVGVAGVVALICVILLKVFAVSALFQVSHLGGGEVLIVILAPLIGRAMILLMLQSTDYVRQDGLASSIIKHLPRDTAGVIIIVCLLLGLLISFWGLVFVATGFWLLRRLMIQRLSGCTGDTLGATVEISEMLWLLGACLII